MMTSNDCQTVRSDNFQKDCMQFPTDGYCLQFFLHRNQEASMSVTLPYSQMCDGTPIFHNSYYFTVHFHENKQTHISSLVTTLPKMSSHVHLSLKKCGWSASMSFVVIYQLSWLLSTTDLSVSCTLVDNIPYMALCKRFNIFLIIKPTRCTNFSNLFLE
jgi:hypothetical protein